MGRAPHRSRVRCAGAPRESHNGLSLSPNQAGAVAHLADLSAPACPRNLGGRLFTVQTRTLRTFYVFFVISHARRRILHGNVTAHPTAPWVWRQIIAATPWNTAPRFLIRDRDRNDGGHFVPKAAALGIETILTPVRAPEANAIAERVIGTIRPRVSGPSHRAHGTASPGGCSASTSPTTTTRVPPSLWATSRHPVRGRRRSVVGRSA